MSKRSDRPISDLQKIDITVKHLKHRTAQAQLAKEYRVSPSTISRIVDEVLNDGWVVLSVKRKYTHRVNERPDLVEKIKQRYHGIENVYVLDAPEREGDYATWSDEVHQVLGSYLGRTHLRPAICSEDSIGVSSGRGVYYTIEAIYADLIRAEDVTILSLTGSFENRAHGLHEPAIMDGDTNAALLALGFGRMVRLQTVGRGVVVEPTEQRPAWFSDPPKRALVGLGVLERTNRILLQSPTLRALNEALNELHRLVQEDCDGNYIPCADMCNCLIWVPPPKDMVVKNELEIRKLIELINTRLCVIPFEQLLKVRSCWIAAGTAKKARALHHCLAQGLQINGLCVDTTLATELLQVSA
jgi:DNA-binding transcriptional regulator LsrR (DeoR family)